MAKEFKIKHTILSTNKKEIEKELLKHFAEVSEEVLQLPYENITITTDIRESTEREGRKVQAKTTIKDA